MASTLKQDLDYSLARFSLQEKEHILSFLRDLQDRKRIERSSIRKWLKDDFYQVPAGDMPRLLGCTEQDIQTRTKQGEFPHREGSWKARFYDLRTVIKFLWDGRGSSGMDVDKELKKKRIIGEDIKNKIKLRQYISKSRAEERSVRILNAAMNMIQYAIKKASPQLVGCTTSIDAEMILTSKFREALTVLKEEATNKEWVNEISDEPLLEELPDEQKESPSTDQTEA